MTEPRGGIYGFIHMSTSFLRKRVLDHRKIASTRIFHAQQTHPYFLPRSRSINGVSCQTKATVTIQGTILGFCNPDNNSAKKNQPTTGYPTTLESVPTNADCFWRIASGDALSVSTLSSGHSTGSNSHDTSAQSFQESSLPVQSCPKRPMSNEATVLPISGSLANRTPAMIDASRQSGQTFDQRWIVISHIPNTRTNRPGFHSSAGKGLSKSTGNCDGSPGANHLS